MNFLDQILGGDYFMGVCDECRQAKPFRTERERDLWEKFHAHEEAE
jgi:hypothetical protein